MCDQSLLISCLSCCNKNLKMFLLFAFFVLGVLDIKILVTSQFLLSFDLACL